MTNPRSSLRDRAAAKSTTTAVATTDEQPRTLSELVEVMRPQMARVLPEHIDADRMARIALTELRKTPELAECSQASFMGALMTASQLGLEPGAGTQECYLIPYKKEATLVIGYHGYIKLFWQHPLARHLDAQAVRDGDDFDYAYGLAPFLVHKPRLGGDPNRPVVAYYACATLTTGGSAFVVLSPAEVRELRNGAVGPSGRIKDPQLWMERKTAIRQLLKTMPKSPLLVAALAHDGGIRTDPSPHALEEAPRHPAIPGVVEQQADEQANTRPDLPHTFVWGDDGAVECGLDGCDKPEPDVVHTDQT